MFGMSHSSESDFESKRYMNIYLKITLFYGYCKTMDKNINFRTLRTYDSML